MTRNFVRDTVAEISRFFRLSGSNNSMVVDCHKLKLVQSLQMRKRQLSEYRLLTDHRGGSGRVRSQQSELVHRV